MKLIESGKYTRENNTLYDHSNGYRVAVVRLKEKFIDVPQHKFTIHVIRYMNKYMEMFPQLHEKIQTMKFKTRDDIIKIFYDLETTGTDERKNSIHQIAGVVEFNGEIVEEFDIKTRPHPKAIIEPKALLVGNVLEDEILVYQDMKDAHIEFVSILERYCDRYDRKDKMYLVGFNNRKFDDVFLRRWFEQNGDTYFGSWFWGDSLDVMVLACEYLIERRVSMPNFKLKTVAEELGLYVEDVMLHNGVYDVKLTREIYRIVTGKEVEI